MGLNFQNNQIDKKTIAPWAKDKVNQAKQSSEAEKFFEKFKKKKMKKGRYGQNKNPSPTTTKVNTILAIAS